MSRSAIVPLAFCGGAVTGVGAIGFSWLITGVTKPFTGYPDYSAVGRTPSLHASFLGIRFVVLIPVIASAIRRARSALRATDAPIRA